MGIGAASASTSSGIPDPLAANNAAALSLTVNGSSTISADKTAPLLGVLKLSGKARAGRKVTLLSTLSEAATVTLRVERLLTGRRQGTRCNARAKAGNRCTTTRKLGTVKVRATPGTARLVLPAKVSGKKLARGLHRVTATATDAAGNPSKARTLKLTVVR